MTAWANCARCGARAVPGSRIPHCDWCRVRIQTLAHLFSVASIAQRLGDVGAASRIRQLRDELDVLPGNRPRPGPKR